MSRTTKNRRKDPSRREFLKAAATVGGLGVGAAMVGPAPVIWAQNIKNVTLRHVGNSYSAITDIGQQASKDLGFKVQMQIAGSDALINRAVTQPGSVDILDMDHWAYKLVVPRGVLQGIPLSKFKWWDQVVPIFTKGTTLQGAPLSRQGVLPYTIQYLEKPESIRFAGGPTDVISIVPDIYNADTLGYRPDLIERPHHWRELLDAKYAGKTAIVAIPSIGIMDAAMAIESRGDFKYKDKGNMTKEEIDRTVAILKQLKARRQFRAFWNSFDESVNLMASGEVVLQSMWSPAVTAVRAKQIACGYPLLAEGYRAWASGLGVMRHVKGVKLDAAHEYLNWYLSGWQGGFIAKQGYYSSVPDTAKKFLTPDEWGYWYEGKPATAPITDPFGTVMAKSGEVREGGSLWDRMGHVACWNTVMDNNNYMVQQWISFLSA